MKYKKYIFILSIILSIFGIIMIYSSSSIWSLYKFGNSFYYAKMQIIYLFCSLIAYFIIKKFNINFFYKKSNLILFLSIFILIIVLIPFIGSVKNGSRSWIDLGIFNIQPSEFAKIGLIIFTSKYLSKNKSVFPILLVLLLIFGLIMLEPDFGSGMVVVCTIILMLFSSGVSLNFFGYSFILGIIGITLLIIIAPYRLARIISFLNPWNDPLGSGYQIIQSFYGISSGGLFGLGFGNSIQKRFYLPEPQNDFIFSIICEEFGIIGGLLVIILFFLLFYFTIKIVLKEKDPFVKYLKFGLATSLTFQGILNLCVVVGLVPVTGVTLPFISYGGSSLLSSFIMIAIITM